MGTLYLCGAGNPDGVQLALRIDRALRRWDRIVLLDDDPAKHGRSQLGVEIAGALSMLNDVDPAECEVANLVARTTAKRSAVRCKILAHGLPFARLTDPSVDATGAELARDTIVYQNATIGAEATIDDGSVVFMGAVVGHESRVGPCCVIGANAVLNARVRLEEGVYVGTNATILPEIRVGAWATIGAGSVVLQDVPSGATVMGVPGQILTSPAERSALGRPDDACECHPEPRAAGSPSREQLEDVISRIWCEALGQRTVVVDQNFFDQGGSSLLALKVYEQLRSTAGLEVRITDLFHFPTVRSLAEHLSDGGEASTERVDAQSRAAQRRRMMHRRNSPGE